MNIFISFVSNFCITKNIFFLGKDFWFYNLYLFPFEYNVQFADRQL